MNKAADKPDPWPEAKIAKLRDLWSAGLSCSQIAEEIGGISRNSVIGKVHRRRLKARVNPTVARKPVQRDHKAAYARKLERKAMLPTPAPRPPRDYPKRALMIDVPPPRYLSLTDPLFFKRCRFITPMPGETETRYCGNEVIAGSWCPAHHQIVFVPAEERRRARAAA